jgi:prepilin-type N-terminal cleavage/methylation domain-containing protein
MEVDLMQKRAGFTMIEIIVIIAVISILAGFLSPTVMKQIQRSKSAKVKAEIEAISTAFSDYFTDTGQWPNWDGVTNQTVDLVDYRTLYTNAGNTAGWDGPYLDKGVTVNGVLWVAQGGTPNTGNVDAWGNLYRVVYARAGTGRGGPRGTIAVVSGGPNRVINTSDQNVLRGQPSQDDIVKVITRVAQ